MMSVIGAEVSPYSSKSGVGPLTKHSTLEYGVGERATGEMAPGAISPTPVRKYSAMMSFLIYFCLRTPEGRR